MFFNKSKDTNKVIHAFPIFLRSDVLALLKKVRLKSEHEISQTFEVIVESEQLAIPCRVYFEEPVIENLSETQKLVLNCLFTRHHDGFVRQRNLEQIISTKDYWITPFIIQQLGEYVCEILDVIEENLSDKLLDNTVRFITENPKFFETTKSRVISYWDIYYRCRFPDKENYVGVRILKRIDSHFRRTL